MAVDGGWYSPSEDFSYARGAACCLWLWGIQGLGLKP